MIPAQIVGGSRFRLAVLVGLLSTAYVLFVASQQPPGAAPDFYLWWVAARDWRMGLDPYDTIRTAGWQWPLYYPGTTVVLTAPLTWLSPPASWALFEGLGAGLCCWAITRTHMWRAILFLSGSFLATLYVGQASTWLIAAALMPWLGGMLTFKPTLGLALGLTHLSRNTVLSVVVVLVTSLVLFPTWPGRWWTAIADAPEIVPPIFRPGGALLLLALFRWRRPEARLFLAMVCVPHTTLIHEALPLGLIPASRNEMRVFAATTLLAALASRWAPQPWGVNLAWSWYWVLSLAYLPVLIMLLRRPARDVPAPWQGRNRLTSCAGPARTSI